MMHQLQRQKSTKNEEELKHRVQKLTNENTKLRHENDELKQVCFIDTLQMFFSFVHNHLRRTTSSCKTHFPFDIFRLFFFLKMVRARTGAAHCISFLNTNPINFILSNFETTPAVLLYCANRIVIF